MKIGAGSKGGFVKRIFANVACLPQAGIYK